MTEDYLLYLVVNHRTHSVGWATAALYVLPPYSQIAAQSHKEQKNPERTAEKLKKNK